MSDSLKTNNHRIILAAADLGVRKVRIPVAMITGEKPGRTLIITAGSDGDEYAGIEAAYRLIELYKNNKFRGRLIIFPVLNIPGFENRSGVNPLDNKYPKHIYPGNIKGSPTERLIYWLDTNYIKNADFWLDLHGVAIDEKLDPFMYFYETGNEKLNILMKSLIMATSAKKIVFLKKNICQKAEILAGQNIGYVMAEAGCLGRRDKASISKHLEWTKRIMGVLGMIGIRKNKNIHSKVYRKIVEYRTDRAGIWIPAEIKNKNIFKNQKIGEIRSLAGDHLKDVVSTVDGEYLWSKYGMICRENETLFCIGYEGLELKDMGGKL